MEKFNLAKEDAELIAELEGHLNTITNFVMTEALMKPKATLEFMATCDNLDETIKKLIKALSLNVKEKESSL